jgi:integrase
MKGEISMTRRSFQRGYVSNPFHTRNGLAFKIRYRVRAADGKWKQRAETLYGLPGKKAAREVLRQRIRQAFATPSQIPDFTLRSFVGAYWKQHLERKCAKPSTLRAYHSMLDRHILPELGDRLLDDIMPLHIWDFLKRKEIEQLSPKTIRNILVILQSIFNLAKEIDLIRKSPVRSSHKPAIKKQERPVWTPDQVRSIIESVPLDYRSLFICIALSGLRLGELLGLQWKHLDLSSRTLCVHQSLWRGLVVTPKTQGSYRSVPFEDTLGLVMENHRVNSIYARPEDFIFCKRDGSPLNPDVLRKDVLYPALDRLHIPRPARGAGFHQFRHSAASFINAQTGNLKLAQRFLGHSNFSTTADVYTHTTVEAEREAAAVLAQVIFKNSEILFPIVPKTGNRNNSLVN